MFSFGSQEQVVTEEAVELNEVETIQETNPAVLALIAKEEAGFLPLGSKEPPAPDGPDKVVPEFNEDSEIAFITNVFKWQGTVFADVWPQMICIVLWTLIVTILYNIEDFYSADTPEWLQHNMWKVYGLPSDVNPNIIGTVFFFLLVFVMGTSYSNFIEGRKQLGGMCNFGRELAQCIYSHPLKDKEPETFEKAELLRKIIRRKLNLMFAFQRHVTRESHEGFIPDCGLDAGGGADDFKYKGPAQEQNWYRDPCKPAIANLIDSAERDFYSTVGLGVRPAAVQSEINMLCGELSKLMKYSSFFLDSCHLNTEGEMNLFKGTARIVTTKMPMPYKHLLYVLNFIFCFLMPLMTVKLVDAGAHSERESAEYFTYFAGWFTSLLATVICYGMLEIAASLQNPFGHDPVDHDIGIYALRLHNETKIVAKAAGSGDQWDYMKPVATDFTTKL